MAKKKREGWRKEPYRHSLAQRGIETARHKVIPPGAQVAVKGQTYIIDRAGNTIYLPSAGVLDTLSDLKWKVEQWWTRRDLEKTRKEVEKAKAKQKEQELIRKVTTPRGVPAHEVEKKAEPVELFTPQQKERIITREQELTGEEMHQAQTASDLAKRRTEGFAKKAEEEFTDVTKEDVERHTSGEAVDVDELIHVINNRQRLIDLRSDLKHNAEIVLAQAKSLREKYDVVEETYADKANAEYNAKKGMLRKMMDRAGYSAFSLTDTPKEAKIEEMKANLDAFMHDKEAELRDMKREHIVDVKSLQERGQDMLRIGEELDMKVKDMEAFA